MPPLFPTRYRKPMLILSILLKLLILLFVPTASTIYWKYRSGAAWNCALAALIAFVLYSTARPYLDDHLFYNPFFQNQNQPPGPALTWHSFALGIIYGTIRTALHWSVVQTTISKMKIWQDAVLFALAYTTADYIVTAWQFVSRGLFFLALNNSLVPKVGYEGTNLNAIWTLRALPLNEIIEYMDVYIKFSAVGYNTLINFPSPLMLNLGTATAVLYFARYKKPWAFAAASICLMLVQSVRTAGLPMDFYVYMIENVRTGTSLGNFTRLILPDYAFLFFPEVPSICAALPSLALSLHLRRAFARADTTKITTRTVPQN